MVAQVFCRHFHTTHRSRVWSPFARKTRQKTLQNLSFQGKTKPNFLKKTSKKSKSLQKKVSSSKKLQKKAKPQKKHCVRALDNRLCVNMCNALYTTPHRQGREGNSTQRYSRGPHVIRICCFQNPCTFQTKLQNVPRVISTMQKTTYRIRIPHSERSYPLRNAKTICICTIRNISSNSKRNDDKLSIRIRRGPLYIALAWVPCHSRLRSDIIAHSPPTYTFLVFPRSTVKDSNVVLSGFSPCDETPVHIAWIIQCDVPAYLVFTRNERVRKRKEKEMRKKLGKEIESGGERTET